MDETRKRAYERLYLSVSALIPEAEALAGEESAAYNVLPEHVKAAPAGAQALEASETALEMEEHLRRTAECAAVLCGAEPNTGSGR